MKLTYKVDAEHDCVHFQIVQDIALTPIVFSVPASAIKDMAGQLLVAEAQRSKAAKTSRILTPT